MTHVATLISNPLRPTVDDDALMLARQTLPGASPPRWLNQNVAADVFFTPPAGADNRAIADALRAMLTPRLIDVVVQPLQGRAKALFLADMDSTMIEQECIDELADFVGKKTQVAAITERAMRGEIAFEPALIERVALLAGLPESVIDEVIAQRITFTPGARSLVATLRARGVFTCLVSGGFTRFTNVIAQRLGFDEHHANTLMVSDGRLTGDVTPPILGREAKLATLLALRDRLGLTAADTLAVGDGANDLAMLQEAGLGVAFHAKPAVAAAAAARIDHGDLTALLYVQGIERGEWRMANGE